MARGWPLVGRIVMLAPWLAVAGPVRAQEPPSGKPPGELHSPGPPSADASGCPDVHRLRDELDRLRDAVSRARDREAQAELPASSKPSRASQQQKRKQASGPPQGSGAARSPDDTAALVARLQELRKTIEQLGGAATGTSASGGTQKQAKQAQQKAQQEEEQAKQAQQKAQKEKQKEKQQAQQKAQKENEKAQQQQEEQAEQEQAKEEQQKQQQDQQQDQQKRAQAKKSKEEPRRTARAAHLGEALAAIDRIEAELRAEAGLPPPSAKRSPPKPSTPSRASVAKLRHEIAQLRSRVAELSGGGSGEKPSERREEKQAEHAERSGRNPPPAPRRDEEARASMRAPRSGPFDGTIEARSGGNLVVRDDSGTLVLVHLGDDTAIHRRDRRLVREDLQVGDEVRVHHVRSGGEDRATEVEVLE